MQVALFFLTLTLASILVCFSNGAPVGSNVFTPEEDMFIIKELEARLLTLSPYTWKRLEEAHHAKLKAKTKGFSMPRQARKIRRRFVRMLRNKDIEVPDTIRKRLHRLKIPDFFPEEERFINEQLKAWQGSLRNYLVWELMAEIHEQIRQAGCPAFAKKRTAKDLYIHFTGFMKALGLIDKEVKRRFFQEGAGPSDTGRSEDMAALSEIRHEQGSNPLPGGQDSPDSHDVEIIDSHTVEFIDFFEKDRQNAWEQDEDAAEDFNEEDDDNELTKLTL